MNFNEENEKNNNITSKNTDEMKKLLKKLDNQLETNKIKNSLNLPSDDIDLDFDLNFSNNQTNENKNKNNIGNNLTVNINNRINNNINYNNENGNTNNEHTDELEDNIIFKEINIKNNSNLKTAKKNDNINSSKNSQQHNINNDISIKNSINNNNRENEFNIINKSINDDKKKQKNKLLISSMNNNNNDEDNDDDNNDNSNEEFDFDVNEIVDIQKQEMEKKRTEKINDKIKIGEEEENEKEEDGKLLEEKIEADMKKQNDIKILEEEEEKKRRLIEQERKRIEEEEERKRLEEEEERKRLEEEEERKRLEEEEKKRLEEEEEKRRLEEERKRLEEEEKKRLEEEEEEKRRLEEEEEKRRLEEEEKKRRLEEEEEKKRLEEKEEEKRRLEEEEKKRLKEKEEEKRRLEVEDKKKRLEEEEEKKKLEERERTKIEGERKDKGEKNIKKEDDNKKILHQNSISDDKSVQNSIIIPEKSKNSKLFSSLLEEQKNYITSILKDIKIFKAKQKNIINDIDKYPTIKIDVNQKEKTLDDLINNFSDKIKNENKEDIEKRKHYFINHIYFEGMIETNPLLELIPECKIPHIDLLNKIYREQGLKNIPVVKDDYDYETYIFSSDNLLVSEYYSPIGKLEDLKGFIYKYNFEKNLKVIINCFKAFNYWRSIQGDGNSFYRSFMFSLIEYYILYNDKVNLEQIISEITSDELIAIYGEYNINYNIPFIILGLLLKFLSKDEIEKAYDLFIKSYLLKDSSFDKMLIIYLRYISFIYVDEVIKLTEDEQIQEERGEKIIVKNINKELIKTMNVEPNFFIICLMPYLFDININVLWIDKDFLQCKDGIINFIDEDNVEALPLISLGYFFSSYHKIYSNSIIDGNDEIKEIFNSKLNKLTKLTIQINNSKKKCEICNNELYIIFLEQKFKICNNCLQKYIGKICSFRNNALNNNNYIGQEYYSRSFNLKDDYLLNDYEFIEIKEETNIINYIQHFATILCSKCKGIFDKKNLNNLKCKCLLCDKCLEDMILNITNGLKILNAFEKKNLGSIICSSCGNNFSYEDAIDHLKDIKEKDKQNAINRMSNFIKTKCLVCGDLVRQSDNINQYNSNIHNEKEEGEEKDKNKKKENFKSIKNYKIIRIRKENEKGKGIDYMDIDHVICNNCYEKNKSNIFLNTNADISETSENKNKEEKKGKNSKNSQKKNEKKKNKYFVDFEEGECFCFICNKKHYFIDKDIKNGGCCSSGCIIN